MEKWSVGVMGNWGNGVMGWMATISTVENGCGNMVRMIEEKNHAGRFNRIWLAVRRGFAALPRMYWWYAIGCVVLFSVAWPKELRQWSYWEESLGNIKSSCKEVRLALGVPIQLVNITYRYDYFPVVDSPQSDLDRGTGTGASFRGYAAVGNLAFWSVVFLVPMILAATARNLTPDWEHAAAVAWRFVVIALALVLLLVPLQEFLRVMVERWGSSGWRYSIDARTTCDLAGVQSISLGLVVVILVIDMSWRVWLIHPILARWLGITILMILAFAYEWTRNQYAFVGMEVVQVLVSVLLIDCLVTVLIGRLRQRFRTVAE